MANTESNRNEREQFLKKPYSTILYDEAALRSNWLKGNVSPPSPASLGQPNSINDRRKANFGFGDWLG